MDELAGLAEVAQILHISKVTAGRYTARPDFPQPIQRLAAGPVWLRADIEDWGRNHLPIRRGRPPARPPEQPDPR